MGRIVWFARFVWGLAVAGFLFFPDMFRPRFMVGKFGPHMVEGDVLDIGCGPGHIGVYLRRKCGRYVMMVDVAPRPFGGVHWLGSAPCAMALAFLSGIPYILYGGKRLPFEKRRFENVLLGFVLSHTRDWKQVLAESVRVLEQGGRLIVLEDTVRPKADRWINFGAEDGVVVPPDEWKLRFLEDGLRVVHSETWTKRHLGARFHNIMFVLERIS